MKANSEQQSATNATRHGQRSPLDDTEDLLERLRSGASVDNQAEPAPPAEAARSNVPELITDVLASDDRRELLEVARMLRDSSHNQLHIVFHLGEGDIRCPISWRSSSTADLLRDPGLFLVKLRSSSMVFIPRAGAIFSISFDDCSDRVCVVCLDSPHQLYPGIDLLCFLPHNNGMEKNGKLAEGAPSVVSGSPSDSVSENGEPIRESEKVASWPSIVAPQDFDQPRPSDS